MFPTDAAGWFMQILTFIYFSCKDFILSKLFKDKELKVHPVFSILMTLAGLYVNSRLLLSYNEYLELSPIKGSIVLPPFPLLFILTDFISSVAMILIVYVRIGSSYFSYPFARNTMEVMRFMFVNVVFTIIVSQLWLGQLKGQMNWNYTCFRNQLAIDAAVYYFRKHEMPHKLSDFTTKTINPANNSPLQFVRGKGINITVTDKAGNTLVQGYEDFIGLTMYTDHPEDYFSTRRVMNNTLCKGTLMIPPEFDKEPSWRR